MGRRENAALAFHRVTVTRTGPEPVAVRVDHPKRGTYWLCAGGVHWHSRRELAQACSAGR